MMQNTKQENDTVININYIEKYKIFYIYSYFFTLERKITSNQITALELQIAIHEK